MATTMCCVNEEYTYTYVRTYDHVCEQTNGHIVFDKGGVSSTW